MKRFPFAYSVVQSFVMLALLAVLAAATVHAQPQVQDTAQGEFQDTIVVKLKQYVHVTHDNKGGCNVYVWTVGTHPDPVGNGRDADYRYSGTLRGEPRTFYYSNDVPDWIGINDIAGSRISYSEGASWSLSPSGCSFDIIGRSAAGLALTRQFAVYSTTGGPVAFYSHDQLDGLEVVFDGTDSYVATQQGHRPVSSYRWSFDDGGTSTEAATTHTYALPGKYNVKLTVRDDQGHEDSYTETIEVHGALLAARARIEEQRADKDDTLTVVGIVENAGGENILNVEANADFALTFHFHDSLTAATTRDPVLEPVLADVPSTLRPLLKPGDTFHVQRRYVVKEVGGYRWSAGAYTDINVRVEASLAYVAGEDSKGDTVPVSRPCDEQIAGQAPANCERNYADIGPAIAKLVVNSTDDEGDDNPGDGKCSTGQMVEVDGKMVPECTLRAAIEEANANVGLQSVTFAIPGAGVHTIEPAGTGLPPINDPLKIDATTQPGYNSTPLVVVDGSKAGVNASGLRITPTGGQSTIKGLAIGNFGWYGIWMAAGSGNIIEANNIGTNAAGSTASHNGREGVFGDGTSLLTMRDNVISGNDSSGVHLNGGENIRLLGNRIGTNAAGTAAVANGGHGILVESTLSARPVIGGIGTDEANTISGNAGAGVFLDSHSPADIIGNRIGTNAAGTAAIANGGGGIEASIPQPRIEDNVISGNAHFGVLIHSSQGTASKENGITRNFIGTDLKGTKRLPNQGPGVHYRFEAQGHELLIGETRVHADGGPPEQPANVISGNAGPGVWIESTCDVHCFAMSVTVSGNFIGTDVTGTKPLGNTGPGVLVENTGGVSYADGGPTNLPVVVSSNLISGNAEGVVAQGDFFYPVAISNNLIGGAATRLAAVGNLGDGIRLQLEKGGAHDQFSPPLAGVRGNTIVGNQGRGIAVLGGGGNLNCDVCHNADIEGNRIGFALAEGSPVAIGNKGAGVHFGNGANHNRLGSPVGFDPGGEDFANVIAHNNGAGVVVADGDLDNLRGNWIFANGALPIDLGADGRTDNDNGDEDSGPNERQNNPDVVKAWLAAGEIFLTGHLSSSQWSDYYVDLYVDAKGVAGFGDAQGFVAKVQARTPLTSGGFGDYRAAIATRVAARAIIPSALAGGTATPAATVPVAEGWMVRGLATERTSSLVLGELPYGNTSELSFTGALVQPAPTTTAAAAAGGDRVSITSNDGFAIGDEVTICPACENEENATIADFGSLIFQQPLRFPHAPGEAVVPFVRSADTLLVSRDTLVYFGAGTAFGARFAGVSGAGHVAAERFRRAPAAIAGISEANVIPHRWVVALDSTLTFGAASEVSFSLTGIPNLSVGSPQSVVVYRRPVPGSGAFQPLPTRYDPALGTFVASGVTGFGEFVLATDQSIGVETDGEPKIPAAFALSLAYPNPFSSSTKLLLDMPEPGQATVTAYDALGRRVALLLDGELEAGRHGVRFEAGNLPSGVYIIRALTARGLQSRSVVLAR